MIMILKMYIAKKLMKLIKSKKIYERVNAKKCKNIKKYRGKIPLFHDANIEKELNNIYEPTVKLKSGGYLVINPTEALVSIIDQSWSINKTN